jgi:hypothetical protein
LLYGGQHLASNSDAPMLDDLWSWDGRQWTKIAGHTGIGMLAHKLFADGTGGVFAHGGFGGVTARWDGQRWATVVADVSSQREAAAGAYDVDRKRFVLFGGHVGGRSFPRETWEFDGQRWERLSVNGPGPMLGSAMAYDGRRRAMVLFGGLDSTGRKLADTWLWNGQTWRAVSASPAPPARSEGYIAYDDARGLTVLFGSEGTQTVPSLGDTWEWDGTRWHRRL